MNCKITLLLASILLWTQAGAQDISIKGSDTMLPLVEELAQLYASKNGQKVAVAGGGSVTGIQGLQNGTAQIAMCSRDLKGKEKTKLSTVKKAVIAYDALSIIIHANNGVEKLTKQQLKGIFTGKIKNWKEVGGMDIPIKVVSRDSQSGTYGFMKKTVLEGQAFSPSALIEHSNAGIVQKISRERGAIGYVGLAHVEDVVKTVAISFDGKKYIKPTFKNALEKTYPIIRPLYYFYSHSDTAKLSAFTKFTLSDAGQKVASYKGYIPAVF